MTEIRVPGHIRKSVKDLSVGLARGMAWNGVGWWWNGVNNYHKNKPVSMITQGMTVTDEPPGALK